MTLRKARSGSLAALLLLLVCAVRIAPTWSAVTAGSNPVVNVFAGETSSEPTEPTEPTESAEPTEPTESTEPAESTEPTEPTEPTESTEPAESTESAETGDAPGGTSGVNPPDTGDQTRLPVWGGLILLAAAGMAATLRHDRNIR